MKKIMMTVVAACAALASYALSIEEARGKIGTVVSKPSEMTKVMKQLSAADQKTFLGEVNAAIDKLPGSNESRVAMFLNVNKAALRGAAKGNLGTLVAEVFATVPLQAMTVLNESLASDMFNRAADPSVSYTDEQFMKIAETIIDKVADRVQGMDDGARREAFAICMFARASNDSIPELVPTMVKKLPDEAQNQAQNKWIPAALGDKQTKDYEPLLGLTDTTKVMLNDKDNIESTGTQNAENKESKKSSETKSTESKSQTDSATEVVSARSVLRIAGPQTSEVMLSDLVSEVPLISTPDSNMAAGTTATPARDKEVAPMPIEPIGYQGQIPGK